VPLCRQGGRGTVQGGMLGPAPAAWATLNSKALSRALSKAHVKAHILNKRMQVLVQGSDLDHTLDTLNPDAKA
jgi:hypothetical protein